MASSLRGVRQDDRGHQEVERGRSEADAALTAPSTTADQTRHENDDGRTINGPRLTMSNATSRSTGGIVSRPRFPLLFAGHPRRIVVVALDRDADDTDEAEHDREHRARVEPAVQSEPTSAKSSGVTTNSVACASASPNPLYVACRSRSSTVSKPLRETSSPGARLPVQGCAATAEALLVNVFAIYATPGSESNRSGSANRFPARQRPRLRGRFRRGGAPFRPRLRRRDAR